MTLLDEAIQRENKIAEENQKIVDTQIVFDDVSLSQLYCDDTEVIEEHLSNYRKCAEYHKQLAEWLEELKEMRKNQGEIADFWYQEGISRESKLIFDKIEEIKNRYDNEDFAIIGILIKIQEIALEMAEQLKAGGNIELSEYSKSKGNRTGKQKATIEDESKAE